MKLYNRFLESYSISKSIHDLVVLYDIDRDYIINGDGSIDVNGDVYLTRKSLDKIPLKFNKVNGHFRCSYNNIKTLENAPKIVTGYFECSSNPLIDLSNSPISVGEYYDCSNCNLSDLKGIENTTITNALCCDNNNINNFDYLPIDYKNILISNNKTLNPEEYLKIYDKILNASNVPVTKLLLFIRRYIIKIETYEILNRVIEFEVVNDNIIDTIKLEQLFDFYDVEFAINHRIELDYINDYVIK